ncbi:hypothetical protein AUF78_13380 [archaeon 13_1_20CM_2_51_12]|nr:MAG: hypothetical protein AUF78_13380 [archaeon 13_1_20CM_2_51_12]
MTDMQSQTWLRTNGISTRKLALTATFAAVYAVFRLIPISRTIGIPGSITAGGVILPVVALFLDLPYAVASVIIGTFIAAFAPWNPLRFLGLDFLPGVIYVTIAGLVLRGQRKLASAIFLVIILVFSVTPNTEIFVGQNLFSPPIPYYWLHIVALTILISPLTQRVPLLVKSGNYAEIAKAVAIVAFVGTMAEHLTGGILFALVVGSGALKAWPLIFLFYPIERLIITVGAAAIGKPLIWNTRKIFNRLEPQTKRERPE